MISGKKKEKKMFSLKMRGEDKFRTRKKYSIKKVPFQTKMDPFVMLANVSFLGTGIATTLHWTAPSLNI